jgi:hypothetical protein
MHLFLDAEFAGRDATELVSLALVSEDGGQEFYAERDPLPEGPTEFVSEHVYPLLDRGDAALDDVVFTWGLRASLPSVEYPHIICDFCSDCRPFNEALNGVCSPGAVASTCGLIPRLSGTLANSSAITEYTEARFAARAQAKRHHALVDARALRAGWTRVEGHAATNG